MNYTVYQTTNNINSKIYIGMHTTDDLNDEYLGSGLHLSRAIKKSGIENFTKKILFVYDSEEQMVAKEVELVNEDFVARSDTYNLRVGGKGGAAGKNNTFYGKTHSAEIKAQISEIKKELFKKKENHPRTGAVITDEHKALLSEVHKGKTVSQETRQKMSKGKMNNKNGCGNKGKPWSAARRTAYEVKKEII